MIYFNKPIYKDILNEYIDQTYIQYLHESNGISTQLIDVQYDLYNKLTPLINKKQKICIYTGYNWDFNIDNLVKLHNKNKPYPLYINLCIFKNSNKDGETYRNLTKEKQGDTKIIINLSLNCNDLLGILIHELQHIRELYAKPTRNVLASNPKNVYANPNLSKDIQTLYKDILYYMSDAEQHAHLQSIYSYVLTHPEINNIEYRTSEFDKVTGLKEFYDIWQTFYTYKQYIKHIPYLQEISLKFGLLLKTNFKYKNSKLTNEYLKNIQNNKIEFDISIYQSIAEFIHNNLINYQRKVARTIYKAIEDRNNK